MTDFTSAAQVRKYLRASGIDSKAVSVRRGSSPFTGRLFFWVSVKDADGPIVTSSGPEGTTFYGVEGSESVRLYARLQGLQVANIMVGG